MSLRSTDVVKTKSDLLEELNQEEDEAISYDWIEATHGVNFWAFLNNFRDKMDKFYVMLEIDDSPASGWTRLVEILGLNAIYIKWCEIWCEHHAGGGPLRTAFEYLKLRVPDLSLGSVLEALKDMGRFDILLQISWQDMFSSLQNHLHNETKFHCDVSTRSFDLHACQEKEGLVMAGNAGRALSADERLMENTYKKKRKCPVVMVLYAEDGKEEAVKIISVFRTPTKMRCAIKVLDLSLPSVMNALAISGSNALIKWFHQVNYVVPVLTPMYLKQIQNIPTAEDTEVSNMNRLLYRLMLDQYMDFGSRNFRVRPLCSKEHWMEVHRDVIVKANGLFRLVWSSAPEKIERLAELVVEKPAIC